MLGNWGHISVIISFVTVLMATIAFYIGHSNQKNTATWLKNGKIYFYVHVAAVLSTVVSLFCIIYFQHYEYHYAWSHSSNTLPWYFIISSFWEGQEGSFLLWIFWNAVLGLLFLNKKSLTPSTATVFTSIQVVLVSMVLGTYFTDAFKLGSSPFMRLREVLQDPVFVQNPDFRPANGSGLNPLLQNIWMVIHPPVIFLGFALAGIPFAKTLGMLWNGTSTKNLHSITTWTLYTLGVLGLGIMMGAYWAYETLNFGGYWNWDPVENAVLVPWIAMLCALHGLFLYKKKQKGLGMTVIFLLASYLLILYSTFLTRSGILGNASVHSFTDLGLSGQLLVFVVFFVLASVALIIKNKSTFFKGEENLQVLSLDFWLYAGITILAFSAFQVIVPTSFPVINKILASLGIDKNYALPSDQVHFYSKFQLWFAIGFCLASTIAQTLHWKGDASFRKLEKALALPLISASVITAALVVVNQINELPYIFLLWSAFLLLASTLVIGYKIVVNGAANKLGGTLAHFGMALMLVGFVYSAGLQTVISQNVKINAPDSNLPIHTIQENLLLKRNVTEANNGYQFSFYDKGHKAASSGEFIPSSDLIAIGNEKDRYLLKTDSHHHLAGDTILIETENTFYAIEITHPNGAVDQMLPRIQNNPSMGVMASPAVKSFLSHDLYTHVTNFPNPEKVQNNEEVIVTVRHGEVANVHGLQFSIADVVINPDVIGIEASEADIPLEATVTIIDQGRSYEAHPVYFIGADRNVRLFPDVVDAIGTQVVIKDIDPVNKAYTLSITTSQRDWITIKSIKFPLISLVWLGTLVMLAGIGISISYYAKAHRTSNEVAASTPVKEAIKENITLPTFSSPVVAGSISKAENAKNVFIEKKTYED